MEKTVVLKAEQREIGSKHAAKLRELGKIPAVVYGHKEEPVAICVGKKELVDALHEGHRVLEADIAGKTETLLVKDVQYDYLGKEILHLDFMRVNLDEKATVIVPVVTKGEAKGESKGGIVDVHVDHLEINCPVVRMPESLVVKVTGLDLDEAILAKDIALPMGAELITDPETLVINCHTVIAKAEEEGEEGEAEPEVITEKKEA